MIATITKRVNAYSKDEVDSLVDGGGGGGITDYQLINRNQTHYQQQVKQVQIFVQYNGKLYRKEISRWSTLAQSPT